VAAFLEYAGNDIEAMRADRHKLPEWNYKGASWRCGTWTSGSTTAASRWTWSWPSAVIRAIDEEQERLRGAWAQ
jgi:hypothetical protein